MYFRWLGAVLSALFFFGCATFSPETRRLLDSGEFQKYSRVTDVKFIPQPNGDCGPTALAAAMDWAGQPVAPDELRPQVYTPAKKGSLPSDLISASRSQGLMAVTVNSLESLVKELEAGHPVIVLQNLGFRWAPNWHYAVATGYDLDRQVFFLNSGDRQSLEMPMTYFERYWSLANHWALVVLPPDQLSASGDELGQMKAASGLEAAGRLDEAEKAYTVTISKWPQSLAAYIGLANIAYQKKDFLKAQKFLRQALKVQPGSSAAKNNLQVIEQELRSAKAANRHPFEKPVRVR